MKKFSKITMLAVACLFAGNISAQTVKLNGIGHNNRYDDGDQMKSEYAGWNSQLGKAIFIVDNGLYTMSWDGASLTTPTREPAVTKSDVMSSDEKQLWASNFNMMYGNSGAAYINGKLVTIMSRDESSTTDENLFAVRKWDAKTGELLYSRIFPKSATLESAGMAYNPKDGKVYGLFYLTGNQLPESITSDPEYFADQDDDMTDGDAGYAICTIDMATMKVTPITPGLYYYNFITFAINSEGRAFALTSGGSNGAVGDDGKIYDIDNKRAGAQLFEFDLTTGLMKTNAKEMLDEATGEVYTEYVNIYAEGTGYCSQAKRQSACFDKNNPNIMYWVGYYNSGKGINDWGSWGTLSDKEWRTNGKYDTSLYMVDITTGDATRLANVPNRWTFSALWVDGNDPSDGADINIAISEAQPINGAYIALATADNGGIWQQVELGQKYTYFLEPAVGWKLHSVSFNNEDVTEQVTADNLYTTPTISSMSNTLFVVFEQSATDAITTPEEAPAKAKVLAHAGGISISGAQAGDMVQVYNLDGCQVMTQQLRGSEANIDLPAKQLYIIKVGTQTMKVRL